jgi:hypothetical protein
MKVGLTFSNERSIQKFKAKSYDPFTLGRVFPACLIAITSNVIVMLSTKHFELAPKVLFCLWFCSKLRCP